MSVKCHISPNTGEARKCSAAASCPFGGENEHYENPSEARAVFEKNMESHVHNSLSKKEVYTLNNASKLQSEFYGKMIDIRSNNLTPASEQAASVYDEAQYRLGQVKNINDIQELKTRFETEARLSVSMGSELEYARQEAYENIATELGRALQ